MPNHTEPEVTLKYLAFSNSPPTCANLCCRCFLQNVKKSKLLVIVYHVKTSMTQVNHTDAHHDLPEPLRPVSRKLRRIPWPKAKPRVPPPANAIPKSLPPKCCARASDHSCSFTKQFRTWLYSHDQKIREALDPKKHNKKPRPPLGTRSPGWRAAKCEPMSEFQRPGEATKAKPWQPWLRWPLKQIYTYTLPTVTATITAIWKHLWCIMCHVQTHVLVKMWQIIRLGNARHKLLIRFKTRLVLQLAQRFEPTSKLDEWDSVKGTRKPQSVLWKMLFTKTNSPDSPRPIPLHSVLPLVMPEETPVPQHTRSLTSLKSRSNFKAFKVKNQHQSMAFQSTLKKKLP